jgi:hypothetical protein
MEYKYYRVKEETSEEFQRLPKFDSEEKLLKAIYDSSTLDLMYGDKITYEEITVDEYIDHLQEECDKLLNENYNLLTKMGRIYGIASDPKSQEPGGPIYIGDTGEAMEDEEYL